MQRGGDDDLIRAARDGDETAFAALLQRHRDWVCRLIYAVVQDQEQAEDLTQEAFYRVYQNLGFYTAQGQFVPWLKRIAVNLARNFLRDRLRDQRRESALTRHTEQRPGPQTDPAAILASRLLQEEIRDVLERLSPEARQALALHYFAGLSIQEIAERADCPEGTVKSRLFHARRLVRQAFRSKTDER